MELLLEIFFEIYIELMLLIVPEKNRSKKIVWISKVIAVFIVLGIVALFLWGIVLIMEFNNLWGIAPIATASVLSFVQIVAGIVLYKKNH